MYRQIRFLLFVGILLLSADGFTQRIGLLPPSVKWQQIRNDSLRVIFPEGEDKRARRVASLMLRLAAVDPITTTGRYRPISVILQPQTNVSNGYVGLAPYVSEFYLQSNENPFALGSLPWEDLLAIHEYRHVQQVNAANRGISHIIKLIFGDFVFSGLYSLSVPNWYREGDAVYAETKWTLQGRGRLSSFTLPFQEKLHQGVTWNYYQLRNGSYREFTPDYYSLGYLLVQYGNHVFGEATWDTILQEAPTFKYLYKPFSGALKARYGKRTRYFYHDAMEWYAGQWEAKREKDINYPLVTLNEKDLKNDFFDIAYPGVSEDGSIYTAVTTFDHTAAIYKIKPNGDKHKIASMGLQQNPYFDHNHHRLVWTELRFDPRWIRRDKNVMIVFDEEKNKRITIIPKKGFFTPSLSPMGDKIAVLHTNQEDRCNIEIFDARNGDLLGTLPNKNNIYLEYPIWNDDNLSIIAVERDDIGRMAIVRQDIATGDIAPITHFSFNVVGRPFLHDHWIFVTSNQGALDQVYAIDKNKGTFYQVSDGNKAHYDPVWDPSQNAIICSEYALNGKKLVRLPGLPREWKLVSPKEIITKVEGASGNLLDTTYKERSFGIHNYLPWSDAINIHSWTATINDPFIGAEVRSDNIMNNISIAAGIEYNRNEKSTEPYATVKLGMWYPVISFGVSQISQGRTSTAGQKSRISNDLANIGFSLPLYFTHGVCQQTIELSTTYYAGLGRERPKTPNKDDFSFYYTRNRMVLINSRNRAYRQPMPSWGQRLDVNYSHQASGIPISQLYMASDLAFPGIKASHYFLLHGEFLTQKINVGYIQLSSPYIGARGFNVADGNKQYRLGITYGFPVFYPDFGFGSIFYSRRIRLQPFYDIAFTNNTKSPSQWMRSAGAELIVDLRFPDISLGFRFSKLLSKHYGNSIVPEFFIPVLRF